MSSPHIKRGLDGWTAGRLVELFEVDPDKELWNLVKPTRGLPPLFVMNRRWLARSVAGVESGVQIGGDAMKKRLFGVAVLALMFVLGGVDSVSAAGPGGRGGAPSFDTLLGAFDANDDGELAEDEVPAPVWRRLSNADADDNGSVTRYEFQAARKSRGGK